MSAASGFRSFKDIDWYDYDKLKNFELYHPENNFEEIFKKI